MPTQLKNGSIKIHELRDHEFSFTALLNKRVDLFPYNYFAGMYYINSKLDREKAELITYNEKPIKISVYHLLLSKKLSNHQEIMERFNSGLQKIQDNGIYNEILEQYGMK